MRAAALAALALLSGPVSAQNNSDVLIVPPEEDGTIILPGIDRENLLEPDLDLNFVPDAYEVEDPTIPTQQGQSAFVRGLDKLSGTVEDLEIAPGQTLPFGKLQVTLWECRYPADNPSGDAYAYLEIRSPGEEMPVFEGWMIASSPALNAIDHSRYDLWVLRCKTS